MSTPEPSMELTRAWALLCGPHPVRAEEPEAHALRNTAKLRIWEELHHVVPSEVQRLPSADREDLRSKAFITILHARDHANDEGRSEPWVEEEIRGYLRKTLRNHWLISIRAGRRVGALDAEGDGEGRQHGNEPDPTVVRALAKELAQFDERVLAPLGARRRGGRLEQLRKDLAAMLQLYVHKQTMAAVLGVPADDPRLERLRSAAYTRHRRFRLELAHEVQRRGGQPETQPGHLSVDDVQRYLRLLDELRGVKVARSRAEEEET